MKLYDNIKRLRIKNNLSQEEVAKKIGYTSRSSIAKIESGGVDLSQSKIFEFARLFGVTPQELMGLENDMSMRDVVLNKFKLYENPISAGLGSWLDEGTEYNYIEIEHPPVSADFALKVRGDSMSPMYNDGDIVFVKSHTLVEPGQVGVFLINGEGYLKQWQGNRLLSLNKDYDPIYVEEEDQFMIVGKVVDKLTK